MSGEHSFFPPSSAKAWRKCAAWPSMNQSYPQEDSEASREGSAAHWAAWELYAESTIVEGSLTPCGTPVTDEMLDGANLLLEVMKDLSDVVIEQKISIPRIHKSCFGTPDVWSFDPARNILTVIDYKFGHRFVDEFENEQLICYTAGLLDIIEEKYGVVDSDVNVKTIIVQPRCFYRGETIREWVFKGSDIRGIVNDLHRSAEQAFEPERKAIVNSECCFCPGRHVCNVYQKAVYSDIEMSGVSLPLELPPEAASLELSMIEQAIERMKGRMTGLQQVVEANIKAGKSAPWHSLQKTFGRSQWSVPNEQIIAIGKLYGQDLSKPGVLTPKQAIEKGIDESVVKDLSNILITGMKLVPFDPKNVSRIFK